MESNPIKPNNPTNIKNSNENKFTKEELLRLIQERKMEYVSNNLDKFQGLDQEIFIKLIETKVDCGRVISYLDKFEVLDYEKIIHELFKNHYDFYIPYYLDKFKGVDHKKIALDVINAGHAMNVAMAIDKFKGLNHNEIILKIIDAYSGELDEEGENPYDYVIENLYKFKFSPQELFDKAKEVFPSLLLGIENKFPLLANSLRKSPEALISVLMIRNNFSNLEKTINKNIFLQKALEQNPRYACKLIFKYQEFDKNSKENIKELFDNKYEIQKDNPKTDPNSIDFRKLMQERLYEYKNNQKIISEMKNRGIEVDNWLNYKESMNFSLGEEEDVKFSDKIQTPIKRIKETLDKYQNSIMGVLSEYKNELMKAYIPNPETKILDVLDPFLYT